MRVRRLVTLDEASVESRVFSHVMGRYTFELAVGLDLRVVVETLDAVDRLQRLCKAVGLLDRLLRAEPLSHALFAVEGSLLLEPRVASSDRKEVGADGLRTPALQIKLDFGGRDLDGALHRRKRLVPSDNWMLMHHVEAVVGSPDGSYAVDVHLRHVTLPDRTVHAALHLTRRSLRSWRDLLQWTWLRQLFGRSLLVGVALRRPINYILLLLFTQLLVLFLSTFG